MGARLQYFCDVHELQDEDAIAEPGLLGSIGFNGDWYKFLWCKRCFADNAMSMAELLEMITEHGVKLRPEELAGQKPVMKRDLRGPGSTVVRNPSRNTDAECLWCDYEGTDGALGQHVRTKHGFSGFRDAYGRICPMCNAVQSALGTHGQKSHDALNLADLFKKAMAAGDPHGIVAVRLNATGAAA